MLCANIVYVYPKIFLFSFSFSFFLFLYIFFKQNDPFISPLPLSKTSQASPSLCISFQIFNLSVYVQFPPVSPAFSSSSPSPSPSPSPSSLSLYFPPLPSFSRFFVQYLFFPPIETTVSYFIPKMSMVNLHRKPHVPRFLPSFFLLDPYFFPLFSFSWASYSTLIAIVYALQLRWALDPSSFFSSPGINGLVTWPAS